MIGNGNLYSLMNLCGCSNSTAMASMLPNIMSPATQMVFSGTGSIFSLGNCWNMFGGYSYGTNEYQAGQMVGLMGLGIAGTVINEVKTNKAQAKAQAKAEADKQAALPGQLRKQISAKNGEIDKELEKLDKLVGEKVTEDSYLTAVASNKEVEKATSELNQATNKIGENNGKITSLSSDSDKLAGEIAALEASKSQPNVDVAEIAAKISAKERDKKEIDKQIEELKTENKELEKSTKEGGKLYEALEKAKKNKETAEGQIKEIQRKVAGLIDARDDLQAQLDNIEAAQKEAAGVQQRKDNVKQLNKLDGTEISRLFGEKIDVSDSKTLGLPTSGNIDKATTQRILCKYRKGSEQERAAIREWLKDNNNSGRIENYTTYADMIKKIINEEV